MVHPNTRKQKSKLGGYGLLATKVIKKGEIIWMFDGKELEFTLEELKKLPKEKQQLAYVYKGRYFIDPDDSAFMNHSCNPNTSSNEEDGLIASRDIQPREEITYDYTLEEIDPNWYEIFRCNCGEKNCKGKIISS